MTGIEPALSAWEAEVLPLNYTRTFGALGIIAVRQDTVKVCGQVHGAEFDIKFELLDAKLGPLKVIKVRITLIFKQNDDTNCDISQYHYRNETN